MSDEGRKVATLALLSLAINLIPCVSYEEAKRVSHWQHVYGVGLLGPPLEPLQSKLKRPGCWPKTLSLLSNLSYPIPTQPLLHMVQHVADWVAPFLRSQHSPPPPLEFFHTPISPHPSPSPTYTRVRGNHHHHEIATVLRH